MVNLHEAIQVCAAVAGARLSDAAIAVMAQKLGTYPPADVAKALDRCSEECAGRLTLRDILSRLPNGHPGAEEAWAITQGAADEGATIVWTQLMAEAWGTVRGMPDAVARRMAFKETYARLVSERRQEPPQWQVTFGHDVAGREPPVLDAIERGRLPVGAPELRLIQGGRLLEDGQ